LEHVVWSAMPGYLMAFDRPDDDFETGEARLEQHLRSCRPGSDVPAARSEPAEPRTHEEYYEALRAADGSSASDGSPTGNDSSANDGSPTGDDSSADDSSPTGDDSSASDRSPTGDDSSTDDSPADDHHAADSRTDHSGWDSVDTSNRPALDTLRVSPERRVHILDGDADGGGGGHRHGVGKPGKTEFPANWDDEKVIATVLDVARKPDKPPTHQDWNDTWLCAGTRDNVEVTAVIERSGDILTGWPEEGGPGVVRNPRKGSHDGN
jgi:hypothetical protein